MKKIEVASDAPPSAWGNARLAIVATPIGNLEDITLRALRALGEADLIAAEDTRKAKVLLERHGVAGKRLVSYHAFNERGKTAWLLEQAAAGLKVALVSDAGTPCVSDPGFFLVREAVRQNIDILVVPGVSSLTFAVAAAALPVDKFSFYGFLPNKSGRRRRVLEEIAASGMTAFILESPKRVQRLLDELAEVLGPDASAALVREATKLHEETLRGTVAELIAALKDRVVKGECVLAVYPARAGRHDAPDDNDAERAAD